MKMFKEYAIVLVVGLAAVCAHAQTRPVTTPATTQAADQLKFLPPGQCAADLRSFLLEHVRHFVAPSDPKAWEMQAEKLRQRVLDEVIFRGVPADWRQGPTKVIWGETLPGKGYTIRKLCYEVVPGLWAGALLYEPTDLKGKRPGVLNTNGHVGKPGMTIDYKQERCINLVKRGMVALSTEFIGMGQLSGPGYVHWEAAHLDLCGRESVSVFYLALTRALDILCAHPSVDAERVAVTGLSGGGWQTIVISALDTRVRLCAPVAGYTNFEERVYSIADTGDLEQIPADFILTADYPELTAMLYPRPALLIYNDNDDCCFKAPTAIQAVYRPVRPLYEVAGLADRFAYHVNSDPGTHNYLKDNREAFYRFINRHFLPAGERRDEEIPSTDEIRKPEELAIEYPPNNADFHTLAASIAASLPTIPRPTNAAELDKWRTDTRKRLAEVVRLEPDMKVAESSPRLPCGVDVAGGTRGFAWRLRIGGRWTVPAVEYGIVKGKMVGLTLIIADKGLADSRKVVPEVRQESRRAVVTDLLMMGECKPAEGRPQQWPMMLSAAGRRALGIQSSQLAAVLDWLKRTRPDEPVDIIAVGPMAGTAALVTAALNPGCCNKLTVRGLPASLKKLSAVPITYEAAASVFCFGLLEVADVPELVDLAAPTRVEIAKP